MSSEVEDLIKHYKMEILPVEGTLYKRTYLSETESSEGVPHGSAIIALYCDKPHSVSLFHKLTVDEVWHFYGGDPLRLILLYPDGTSRDVIMGSDPLEGHLVQFVIPSGVWQAGHMITGGTYSLYGCTTAPGFTHGSFKAGIKAQLLSRYPDRSDDINSYACLPDNSVMPEDLDSTDG